MTREEFAAMAQAQIDVINAQERDAMPKTRKNAIQILSDIYYETENEKEAIRIAIDAMNQQSATLALLHDLRRYLHDSTGSSLELDTRREALHGMVVDRIREMEGDSHD